MTEKGELALRLLGAPEVVRDGDVVSGFRSTKARALLFYVAVNEHPQARAKLAGLLWGEFPEANADANLRKTLTNLRHLVGSYLTITRDSVSLNEANPPWLDVREFEAALDGGAPTGVEAALDLYRGDFLEGFYVEGAPVFETWLLAERYRLRETLLLALYNLAEYHADRRKYAPAIRHAQQLLALEPLREDVHRLLMSLLAQNGQRARALAQYQACAQILDEELEVEPAEETTGLYESIRDGHFVAPPAALAPRHNLPAPTTSFVGRERELTHIDAWLGNETNRLLTIVGPGGVGKTRLAQQAAWNAIDTFADGVWTVSLTSLEDVSNLPAAVAAELGITFFGKSDPAEQVIRYLRRRELLLVLDNAEHLLSQPFADFLLEILTQAPVVRMIVTSRRRLTMQAEQVLNLAGLAYPDEGEAELGGSAYPAAQLFLQRAEGHGRPLPAGPESDAVVYRICEVVDGLPLALELAATWTPTMSLPEILTAILRGLDLLATHMRDIPPRHRSIEAVFDRSWQMLEEDERRIMRQLAYFPGGFSVDAATRVVGVTAEQLQALVIQSLVRVQGDGRYDMHELIRQYARIKLNEKPGEAQRVAIEHGHYFNNFLAVREERVRGADYLRAKLEIRIEGDSVRKAWEWAVDSRRTELLKDSVETFNYYLYNTEALFSEAVWRFQRAADEMVGVHDQEGESLAARLYLLAATSILSSGRPKMAEALLEQSLKLSRRHDLKQNRARALGALGIVRLWQGDKPLARKLADQAMDLAQQIEPSVDLCTCLNNCGYLFSNTGDYEAAIRLFLESAELSRDNDFFHSYLSALTSLGALHARRGDYKKAQGFFEEVVARSPKAASLGRRAQAVNNLGMVYLRRGWPERAQAHLQEAARLYESVGNIQFAAFATLGLGRATIELGALPQASEHCRQVIEISRRMNLPALSLDALALYARLRYENGERAKAVALLTFVANHPATLADTKHDVHQDLEKSRGEMSSTVFSRAQNEAPAWTLEEVIAAIR